MVVLDRFLSGGFSVGRWKRLDPGRDLVSCPLAAASTEADAVTRRVRVASSLLALSANETLRRRTDSMKVPAWSRGVVPGESRSLYDTSHLSLYTGFSS